jgi:large conductance mechanosensitive channel
MLLGKVNFTDLSLTLKDAVVENGKEIPAVVWKYGAFVQQVVDFIILAFCVFLLVKFITKLSNLKKKEEEAAPAPAPAPEPEPTKEEVLLAEIRDILKQQK